MTRASLLHILDHVSEISDAEIRELEQLAAAFPYCQTAHILLAKTAHDRGSMLASQRLRRAATYAANRDLLRDLLEQPAPIAARMAEPGLAASPAAVSASHPEPNGSFSTVSTEEEAIAASLEPSIAENPEDLNKEAESAPDNSASADFSSAGGSTEPFVPAAETSSVAQEVEQSTPLASEEVLTDPERTPGLAAHLEDEVSPEELSAAISLTAPEPAAFAGPEVVEAPAEAISEIVETDNSASESASELFTPDPQELASEQSTAQLTGLEAEAPANTETESPQEIALSPEAGISDLLPATAPPIRPPAEAGISRFEFELVEPTLPEPSGYLLPDLEEEVAEEPLLSGLLQRTAPAFHADEDLGYALGAGSRLGYDLQPHDGFTLDLPLDAFFEPDALLLAHIAAHRPKPSTSSLDLINRFLKTKPRIKTAAADAKPVEEQADLSVRSIQAAPALASESLAKIMVKQGKIDKAIEIYERLMTRQPEKKAYFADQIQQLKQPSA